MPDSGVPAIPHTTAGLLYAEQVTAGDILACEWVRLACQRQLDDLAKAYSEKDYPYYFDAQAAEDVCEFIEELPHIKGRWARDRELILLGPWQDFAVTTLFGWKRKSDGSRRFRKALWMIPRKNAKSTMAAAIGLYLFCADGEFGAEVYSGATTEKQAMEVFRPARLMIMRSPALKRRYGISIGMRNMSRLGDGSRFEPVVGLPGDGASPSCGIIDEYHEHRTRDLYETLETGMGSREQALLLVVTTAGKDLSSPCYAEMRELQQVLQGVIRNDELFGIIYTIDKDDDWTTKAALRKANPNYDVSVGGDFLRARRLEAIDGARKQNSFKTKYLNLWVNADEAWMDMVAWNRQADPTLNIDDFVGRDCWIGVDLASKKDVAGVSLVFRDGDDFTVFCRHYLPAAAAEGGASEHYGAWAKEGWMILTEGSRIDLPQIQDDIFALARRFGVNEIAFDSWQAAQMEAEMEKAGLTISEIPQYAKDMSDPTKELEALVLDGKFHHNGDPVLTWMVSNVVCHLDKNDNIKPNKDRPENKIDTAIATIMALKRALAAAEPEADLNEVLLRRGLVTVG